MLSTASDRMKARGRHRVGQDEGARQARNFDEVRVGEAPLSAQTRFRCGDRPHQIIGVEAALDERAHLAVARQSRGALSRRKRHVGSIGDLDAREVEPGDRRGFADAFLGSDENGREVPRELTRERHLQRVAIAGKHHRRRERRLVANAVHQALKMRPGSHGIERRKASPDCQPHADGRHSGAGSRRLCPVSVDFCASERANPPATSAG